MPDDADDQSSVPSADPNVPQTPSIPDTQAANLQVNTQVAVDRTELLEKARAFLSSPQVVHEDTAAKRRFLAEKGLSDAEVDGLLREVPAAVPLVPPRTYPQPPPSNLPNLLAGVTRILSWIAGGSVGLLLLYFKFIYPRLSQSYHARHALRSHQRNLLGKLTDSVTALKTTQTETFVILPQAEPFKDPAQYGDCHTLDEFVAASKDSRDLPPFSLLRCAIEGLVSQDQKPTTEDIFQTLESKLPWLKSEEEGVQFEAKLWETLSMSPVFRHEDTDGTSVWSYHPPIPPPPPPLMSSLHSLKEALPESMPQASHYQHTLEALSSLTGYISAHTYSYALPRTNFRLGVASPDPQLHPEEEDVRKEIRALKGLVLNR
ncbi:hypothetical protein BKA93DRAFT_895834 [Sparassis latifolia]